MKIGTLVRVIAIPDDPVVARYLKPFMGLIGRVTTEPDISGGQWIEFASGDGGIFEAAELEELTN